MAKEGYAVGGLTVRYGSVVNGVRIIFMKIKSDGVSLDPEDRYSTEWLGGKGGSKLVDLDAKGRMIVGVTGDTGDIVDSVGLIFLK